MKKTIELDFKKGGMQINVIWGMNRIIDLMRKETKEKELKFLANEYSKFWVHKQNGIKTAYLSAEEQKECIKFNQ